MADHGWTSDSAGYMGLSYPLPPQNVNLINPLIKGAFDLRWDDPNLISSNTPFEVVGVNIYRSVASDRGPYDIINAFPIGGNYYRDQTEEFLVEDEEITWDSGYVSKGEAKDHYVYKIRTAHKISKRGFNEVYANSPDDVILKIDGRVVPVHAVFGITCEITLINTTFFDPITQKHIGPFLPDENTSVTVTYYAKGNIISTALDRKTFYRISTVALDPNDPQNVVETPLELCQPVNNMDVEKVDWIWREAIRRNAYILDQGGERAMLFVRKTAGTKCYCGWDVETVEYSKQPSQRCSICYGTGIEGGYEGPYEILIAPDETERRISQTPNGRRKEHTYEVWIGPTPVVSQRDFIVKQTNERYSIGPVRRPSNRGVFLQQHFNIAYLDEQDIRYTIPIDLSALKYPQTRTMDTPEGVEGYYATPLRPDGYEYPPVVGIGENIVAPMITDDSKQSIENAKRGRTPAWAHTNKNN